MCSYIQQELEAEDHRSIYVVMMTGPTDYCQAFVMARSSGMIRSLKKNKAKPKQGPLLGGATALPTCELPTSLGFVR